MRAGATRAATWRLSGIDELVAEFWFGISRSYQNPAMNFELTPEQQTLQQDAIEFARGELNSNMIERDAQQVSSHDSWKKCAFFEVQSMPIPKEYGGRGADPITTIAMMEGLGYDGAIRVALFDANPC